jgi:hypothetical protein
MEIWGNSILSYLEILSIEQLYAHFDLSGRECNEELTAYLLARKAFATVDERSFVLRAS